MDPDVAAMIGRLRKERNQSLKQLINDALRQGLHATRRGPKMSKRYKVTPMDLGRCLVDSLDNVAEVLAIAEGEDFK